MNYKITEAAYRDLDDIWFYTFQKWSENQANKYFESIIQEIEIISVNPEKAKRMSKVKSDFFYFRTLSHYVFFKYGDDQIEIIRILHKMMDFSKHLE
jgi:toxin ParE1/3/4